MRLDRFDLNLLVVLDVLLEECNVTRASDRLHIGQPAASAALGRLREYFGDDLLVPVGRRLQRTPLAEALIEPVRKSLAQVRATLAQKPDFDAATAERRFRISASDYAVTVLLGEVARRVGREAPGVVLDVRAPGPDVFDVFQNGNIDLMFMPEPYLALKVSHRARLFEDTHVCVVWSGNASVGDGAFTMEQFMTLGHVVVHFGNESSVAFEEWFLPRVGQQRRIEGVVSSFGMVPPVLVGTQRVAVMHRRLAEHFATHEPLRLLESPFEMPPLVEVVCWPGHLDQDPAHAWLRQLVIDCAAAL